MLLSNWFSGTKSGQGSQGAPSSPTGPTLQPVKAANPYSSTTVTKEVKGWWNEQLRYDSDSEPEWEYTLLTES